MLYLSQETAEDILAARARMKPVVPIIVKNKKQKKKQRKVKPPKRPDPFEARNLIINFVFVFSEIGEGQHCLDTKNTFFMFCIHK